MKTFRLLRLLPLLATLLVLPGAGRTRAADANPAPPAVAANGTDVAAFLDRYHATRIASYLAGDPAPLAAFCTDDLRLMPEYQLTIFGRASALAYHRAFLARFRILRYTRTRREILDLGPQVATTGTFVLQLSRRDTGAPLELEGKYLDLWKKSAAGDLALTADAWNYDRPVPAGDDLRFASVPAVNVSLQPHLPIGSDLLFELAALNRWMDTVISQHDGDRWAQFYSADAVLLHNHGPLSAGRAEIHAHLVRHAAEVPVFEHLDIRNDRVDDLGRYVVEYASHVAHWRAGESSGVNTGKDLRIWRREPDGPLKIFRHIGMYD